MLQRLTERAHAAVGGEHLVAGALEGPGRRVAVSRHVVDHQDRGALDRRRGALPLGLAAGLLLDEGGDLLGEGLSFDVEELHAHAGLAPELLGPSRVDHVGDPRDDVQIRVAIGERDVHARHGADRQELLRHQVHPAPAHVLAVRHDELVEGRVSDAERSGDAWTRAPVPAGSSGRAVLSLVVVGHGPRIH